MHTSSADKPLHSLLTTVCPDVFIPYNRIATKVNTSIVGPYNSEAACYSMKRTVNMYYNECYDDISYISNITSYSNFYVVEGKFYSWLN